MISRYKETHEFSSLRRPLLPVPWDKADTWLARLREQGVQATACYDPLSRTAGLELPEGTDVEKIKSVLEALSPPLANGISRIAEQSFRPSAGLN